MNITQIATPEPYRALIFDCDGTLTDTMPFHVRLWAEMYRAFEIEIGKQSLSDMVGPAEPGHQ